MDAIERGEHGKMTALENGCYTLATIPDPKKGPRRVDTDTMYNKERYRPTYVGKLGFPIFLTKA